MSLQSPKFDRSVVILIRRPSGNTVLCSGRRESARCLVLDIDSVPVQVIVTPDDLVFAPDTRDAGLGIRIDVTDAPPLVSFSEMIRDLDAVARKLSTEKNFDQVMGALVMLRYFVAGAKRLGIECRDAESKLRSMWEQAGLPAAEPPIAGGQRQSTRRFSARQGNASRRKTRRNT